MSDSVDILDTMRAELRDLELQHVQLAGRIMQQRAAIKLVEEAMPRKPGRPRLLRNEAALNTYPNQGFNQLPDPEAA
jgi:hypothetical protein